MFGVEIYAVISGSMEPTYKVGSVIYVVDVEPDELKEKDSITFKLPNDIVATHRIVDIQKDENGNRLFQTKGDANDKVDERLVKETEIIGKPIFSIPLLGYLANFVQTRNGLLVTLGVGLLSIIIVNIIDGITEQKKEKEET